MPQKQTVSRILGLGILLVLHADAAWGLTEFRSDEGGFTVLLPGEPRKEQVKNTDAQGDDYVQTQYQVDSEHGAVIVSFQDNPNLVGADSAAIGAALEKGRDVLKNLAKGPVQIDEAIQLKKKYPGRAFAADIPAMKGHIRARMFMVQGRLFQVLVVGTPDFAKSDESTKILESFKLLADTR